MQPNDSTPLTADYIRHFSPETIARVVAVCTREAVSGSHEAYVTREALIDAWQHHRGFANRAQAISDLTAISIQGHVQGRAG